MLLYTQKKKKNRLCETTGNQTIKDFKFSITNTPQSIE